MDDSRDSRACRIGRSAACDPAPGAGRPAAAARLLNAAPSPIAVRLAPVLGGALLVAALTWPPAARAAAPVALASQPAARAEAPAAGAEPAPRERVLDVTLVQTGAPPGPKEVRPPRRPPALAPGAAAHPSRPARPGSGISSSWLAWLAAAMVAAAAALVAWRRRPRRCASCRGAMRRLGSEAAFAALDMAERTEQLVGDVRYEVWSCAACGATDKRGKARDLSGAAALAAAAPVGSAAFLRRRAQAGLSIWSPPAAPTAAGTWPGTAAAAPAVSPEAPQPGDH